LAEVEKMIEGGFDQLPVFERKELVGAIVHQDLMQRVAGGDDYAEMANGPVRHFMRPPFPVVDESKSAGRIGKMDYDQTGICCWRSVSTSESNGRRQLFLEVVKKLGISRHGTGISCPAFSISQAP